MREKLRFLGLDVHAETIAVAVAEPNGEVRSLGRIANREDSTASSSKSLVRLSSCVPAMKPARRDLYCTGIWNSWVWSARLWRRAWFRRSPETG
jgi:hypothetical protein